MTNENNIEQETWKPKYNPWVGVIPILLSLFMFVLDETISNVALTYIAGSMSVSLNESTWVLTSYLVASGIAIPLAGFMARVCGRKNYFILSVIVFTVASFMCSISNSMVMIVLARFIQGLGGGGLLPLGQAMILESFPKEKRAQSMAMFGLVIVFAPLLGPILGGWITENWSWPWIYLINLPIGIICVFLCQKFLEDPPYARKQKNVKPDYRGLTYLFIWLVTLQIVLDKGNDNDWFSTPWILYMSIVSVIFAILFFYSQIKYKDTLIDLSVLKDRTYFFGTLIQVILMAVFLASAALLPSMLQNLLGYSAFLSGLSMGSRGIGSISGVITYLIISRYLGDRRVAMLGLFLLGLGSAFFGMINLEINLSTIALPNICYGLGIFLAMTPLVPLSVSTIKNEGMTNASGIQNLVKNVSGAIGTSISTTMVSRLSQVHQNMMVDKLTFLNDNFTNHVEALAQALTPTVHNFNLAINMAQGKIYSQLVQQAHLWGYIDTFRWFAVATFLLIPMLTLIKKTKVQN